MNLLEQNAFVGDQAEPILLEKNATIFIWGREEEEGMGKLFEDLAPPLPHTDPQLSLK